MRYSLIARCLTQQDAIPFNFSFVKAASKKLADLAHKVPRAASAFRLTGWNGRTTQNAATKNEQKRRFKCLFFYPFKMSGRDERRGLLCRPSLWKWFGFWMRTVESIRRWWNAWRFFVPCQVWSRPIRPIKDFPKENLKYSEIAVKFWVFLFPHFSRWTR